MSRPTRRTPGQPATTAPERPLIVWIIYGLGALAALVVVLSALFTAGAYFFSEDGTVGLDVSPLALVVWAVLILLAAWTWVWRRYRTK
jgi:hypothetical protein